MTTGISSSMLLIVTIMTIDHFVYPKYVISLMVSTTCLWEIPCIWSFCTMKITRKWCICSIAMFHCRRTILIAYHIIVYDAIMSG